MNIQRAIEMLERVRFIDDAGTIQHHVDDALEELYAIESAEPVRTNLRRLAKELYKAGCKHPGGTEARKIAYNKLLAALQALIPNERDALIFRATFLVDPVRGFDTDESRKVCLEQLHKTLNDRADPLEALPDLRDEVAATYDAAESKTVRETLIELACHAGIVTKIPSEYSMIAEIVRMLWAAYPNEGAKYEAAIAKLMDAASLVRVEHKHELDERSKAAYDKIDAACFAVDAILGPEAHDARTGDEVKFPSPSTCTPRLDHLREKVDEQDEQIRQMQKEIKEIARKNDDLRAALGAIHGIASELSARAKKMAAVDPRNHVDKLLSHVEVAFEAME